MFNKYRIGKKEESEGWGRAGGYLLREVSQFTSGNGGKWETKDRRNNSRKSKGKKRGELR